MRVSLIVAVSDNGIIGRDGDLPWRLSADLKRFRKLTTGHHLIMGRKTYDSLPKALPERVSIVMTRQDDFAVHESAVVVPTWERAIEACGNDEDEVFVIGGAQIYELALPHTDRIYRTDVHQEVSGETPFPDWDPAQWNEVHREAGPVDERNKIPSTFRILDRRTD